MKKAITSLLALASAAEMTAAVETAWEGVGDGFEQFCLIAELASLTQMLDENAKAFAGVAHARDADRPGYRWGQTKGRLEFHGGKVEIERPRVRSKASGEELPLPMLDRGGDRPLGLDQ